MPKKTLKVSNYSNTNISIKLYSLLGKLVLEKGLKNNKEFEIQLPDTIKTGIYLVSIQNTYGYFTKKIFIR